MSARVFVPFLAASVFMTQPAFAQLAQSPQPPAGSPPPIMVELSNIEKVVFGETSGKPLGERVARLETTTFGQVRVGALADRVHALDLAIQQGDVGQPAAPEKVETPQTAPLAVASPGFPPGAMTSAVMPPVAPALSAESGVADAKARAKAIIADGVQKMQAGDKAGAMADFREAAIVDDQNPDSFYDQGVIEENGGNLTAAACLYGRASYLAPNDHGFADALASVQKTLSMNATVPTPLQPPFSLQVNANGATAPNGAANAAVPVTTVQTGHPKLHAFAKDLGIALKYTLITAGVAAAVVLAASASGGVSVGSGGVDTCACPR